MATTTLSNLKANTDMSQVKENDNIHNEVNDAANQSEVATNGTSHLDANAEINQVLEKSHFDTSANANPPEIIEDNQQEMDGVKSKNLINTIGISTLGTTEYSNPDRDKDNSYLTLSENLYLTLSENAEINQVLEKSHFDTSANANPPEIIEDKQQEIDGVKPKNLIKTKGTSTLGTTEFSNPDRDKDNSYLTLSENLYLTLSENAEINQVLEKSHFDTSANANPPEIIEHNQQEMDDVKYENIIKTKGISTLGTTAYSHPVEDKENSYLTLSENLYLTLSEHLYLTLVNDIGIGDGIRLPGPAKINTSLVRKQRKPRNIIASIALIIILAILAAGSIWFYTNSKSLKQNANTDENAYTPDGTTFKTLTTALDITSAADCSDVYRAGRTDSGVYNITLQNQTVRVYCDMEHGGGWTVFHNRMDGSVYFDTRTWEAYKEGFGELEGEFWWGNDHLATLTATKQYTLRVDMSDRDNDTAYALYTKFSVTAESDNYRLTAEGYNGTAGNALRDLSSGQAFSTKDRDNDGSGIDCARLLKAGGWFSSCAHANPNGLYYHRAVTGASTMFWYQFKHEFCALKTMSMKFRHTDF